MTRQTHQTSFKKRLIYHAKAWDQILITFPDADHMLIPGANGVIQTTTLTYLGPVLAGPSVWVEVEDDGAGGGEVVSMGCAATAPLTEEEDGGREEED